MGVDIDFRKVEIPEDFDDDEGVSDQPRLSAAVPGDFSSPELEATVSQRISLVRGLLQRGNVAEAVARALDPIFGAPQSLKDKNAAVVFEALTAAKSSEIPAIIKMLNDVQLDTLIKYIYRGMADTVNPALLLVWHEKAVDVAGLGSIVRVLTDKRTV